MTQTHRILTALLGAALFAGCTISLPAPTTATRSAVVSPAAKTFGSRPFYSITPPNGEWQRVESEQGADMEMERRDGSGALIVWTRSGMNLRLDDIVAGRRDLVLGPELSSLRERRYFLDELGQVPASLARYVHASKIYLVLTALKEQRSVEVIGICARDGEREAEVLELVNSLRFVEARP